MKVDAQRLDILLAQQCKSMSDLRAGISPQTLARIRKGCEVLPKTAGKIAMGLGVSVADILKKED